MVRAAEGRMVEPRSRVRAGLYHNTPADLAGAGAHLAGRGAGDALHAASRADPGSASAKRGVNGAASIVSPLLRCLPSRTTCLHSYVGAGKDRFHLRRASPHCQVYVRISESYIHRSFPWPRRNVRARATARCRRPTA
jgi:hypothetical protein